MKAAQYAEDASKTRVHDLSCNASYLGDSDLARIASDLECCVVDSTRMRYPDRVNYPAIPHDVYTDDMAEKVLGLAREILERVRQNWQVCNQK